MSLYGTVVSVLRKAPENRPENEVRLLIPWFTKKSELFRMVTKDVIMDIVKNCLFATVKRNNIIIRQGDRGDWGTVSIYINNTIADGDDELEVSGQTGQLNDTYPIPENELDRSKFGNLIAHFEEGKSFGELALLNKNCVRNATIISDEVCDLVVVPRELYNRCLHEWQAAEFNDRTNFVMSQGIFDNWSHKHKKQMAMSIRKVKMNFDETIVRQGQPVNTLYFLLRGQAKVMMDPAMHQHQYPQFFAAETHKNDSDAKNNAAFLSPMQLYPSALRRRELPRKLVEVCIIGINQIIGDIELSLDLKTNSQTVVCSQSCELYALDVKNFERLVVKRNPRTIEVIREAVIHKIQARLKRHTSIRLPIFSHLCKKAKSFEERKQRIPLHNTGFSTRPMVDFMLSGDAGRGAIIDHYGPGTVYHRLLAREKQFTEQRERTIFRGAGIIGGLGVVHASLPSHLKPIPVEEPVPAEPEVTIEEEKPPEEVVYRHRGHPLGSIFKDWNSSDREMTLLEGKISAWHSVETTPNAARSSVNTACLLSGNVSKTPSSLRQQRGPNMVKLRRVTLQKGQTVKPGTTVVLRPRPVVNVIVSEDEQQDADTYNTQKDVNSSVERKREYVDLPCLLREKTAPMPQFSSIAEAEPTTPDTNSSNKPRLIHFKVKKRHYTAVEYQELKKTLLFRERSMGVYVAA